MGVRRGLHWWQGLVALLVFSVGAARAGTLPGPLVTPQWLHAHVDQVQVVDLRDDLNSLTERPRYLNVGGKKILVMSGGHIPGALSVNVAALREPRKINGRSVRFMLPEAKDFQAVMRASQLQAGKPIVLVPTGDHVISLQEAALLAFELQVFGEPADQIAILNGGMHAWIVIQDLKDHFWETYPVPLSQKPVEERKDMLAEVLTDEIIWDCTTCRACQQACPVYIEHVDKMVDMRRNLVMERVVIPDSAQDALKSLEDRGHPYRGTTSCTSWYNGPGTANNTTLPAAVRSSAATQVAGASRTSGTPTSWSSRLKKARIGIVSR